MYVYVIYMYMYVYIYIYKLVNNVLKDMSICPTMICSPRKSDEKVSESVKTSEYV